MRIETFALPVLAEGLLEGRTAVVIDALRATSSIIRAIENGCREIIPVVEVSDAHKVAEKLGRQNTLLCGERGGLPIEGFDLSNSPGDYSRQRVEGKTAVMTTTNGTKAINAANGAKRVLISAFTNAGQAAKAIEELGDDLAIICAGSNGKFSAEDSLAAGCIIHHLRRGQKKAALELCDLSLLAAMLYEQHKDDLHAPLSKIKHYRHLQSLGLQADLDYCLKADSANCVPVYSNGSIKLI
ncbi:MAG: 2-phosphosulfolactate phosphatase [Christensenellales bacterium]|jgi:2-phosphosulfolactate phosphatase